MLTDAERALLKDSFDGLRADPEAGRSFYAFLFARAPALRSMFRDDDFAGQGMKFLSTLGLILEDMTDPAALSGRIENLARAHGALGVTEEMFDPMGEALLDTLGKSAGGKPDAATAAAWRKAYALVSARMVAAGGLA